MNELALFAGAGGGILGGKLLNWRTICAVEINPYAASVLIQRQNDRLLSCFPIWDDIKTFNGARWRGFVDVVSGGFPCQDISSAGKGVGIDGERSGLWSEMARIVSEIRPPFVFVENSPMLIQRGLTRVLSDLAKMGYDARWGVIGANNLGAPHVRERIWILAYTNSNSVSTKEPRIARQESTLLSEEGKRDGPTGFSSRTSVSIGGCSLQGHEKANEMANSNSSQLDRERLSLGIQKRYSNIVCASTWWNTDKFDGSEPGLGRVANGMAYQMDRLKAIGNGQVPIVAATAFKILKEL
jgi:DNA (cytosine-5)-methyltransferase 1